MADFEPLFSLFNFWMTIWTEYFHAVSSNFNGPYSAGAAKRQRRTLSRNFWRSCFCWIENTSQFVATFIRRAASRATLYARRILFKSVTGVVNNVKGELFRSWDFGYYICRYLDKKYIFFGSESDNVWKLPLPSWFSKFKLFFRF